MKNIELVDFILLEKEFVFDRFNNIDDVPEEVKKAEELLFEYYKGLKKELKSNRKTKTFEAYDLENEIIKRTMDHKDIRQGEAVRYLLRIGFMESMGYDFAEGCMRIDELRTKFLKKG